MRTTTFTYRGRLVPDVLLRMFIVGMLLTAPALSMADSARFDIHEQPLASALKIFADQSHMQLLYQPDTVRGLTANAVLGELDTHVALERLLRHTGLEVVYSSQAAVTIRQSLRHAVKPPGPSAPDEKPVAASTPLPQVTIQSKKEIDQQVHEFVSEAILPVGWRASALSLARWNKAICPSVEGLVPRQRDLILERLSEVSASVGVKVEPPPCNVNVYIVATAEPEKLLRGLLKSAPGLFDGAAPAAVERFFKQPRPVRVWYAAELVGKHGNSLHSLGSTAYNPIAEMSNFEFDDVRHLYAVIEAVDVSRTTGVNVGRVADYVVMAALAEINFEADFRDAPTILRLFDEPDSPSPPQVPAGLTLWDRGFLHGLYVTSQSSKMQRSLIEDVMLRDLAP